MAHDTSGAFIQAATEPPPHTRFKHVLGRMLVESDVISEDQFELVGQVQARTILIATQADFGSKAQKEAVVAKFPNRFKEGEYDLNGAMFGLKPDTALQELDGFIETLGLENTEEKIAEALEGNRRGEGVYNKAAHAKPIINGLFFADYNKAHRQKIADGALIMQHTMRALERTENFLAGSYSRQAALDLLKTSSNIVYKFDPKPLREANESLLRLCTIEMDTESSLQDGMHIDDIRAENEIAVKRHITRLIDAMPHAAEMFEEAGQHDLAADAKEVHAYYSQRYKQLRQVPYVMMAQDASTGFEAPKPKNIQ